MTNLDIAELLRRVAAAYQILGENRFKIIAYERAATSIEHLTSELKDYWRDKKLREISGVGETLAGHLDELFRTGKVKHFAAVLGKLPSAIYPLLLVPGIGPKKAYKLVTELKLKNEKTVIADIEKAIKAGKIAPIEGFGEKSQEDIFANVQTFKKGQIKENRMALPIADEIAQKIIVHLMKNPAVIQTDALGSLRRQVSTIGDIDLAVATNMPKDVIAHFLTFPHQEIIEQGVTGASMRLHNGRQVDLRVQKPEHYGAMLQYFTGSKNHNIALRAFALKKGLSLNEYGIKHVRTGRIDHYSSEESFYNAVKLAYIPPELREDKGEILAAATDSLPSLVVPQDIKGDLHIHSNYDLHPSHDLGSNSITELLDKAAHLGYEYIGISDHNPSITNQSEKEIVNIMKRRKEYFEHKNSSRVHFVLLCEVDILPDGRLALPEEAFTYVDGVIVSVHSSFTQERKTVTGRIIRALTSNPKVRIFGHPTGRLLGKREGVDADWSEVFAVCKSHDIALEINAGPERLDLPDMLVHDAVNQGLKFVIDTDAHDIDGMDFMKYGVSVARRGWVTPNDILNTLGYNEFSTWLTKGG
jgi:DNA polymerase (family 10)